MKFVNARGMVGGNRKILVSLLSHEGGDFKIGLRPERDRAWGRRGNSGLRGIQIVGVAGRGLTNRQIVNFFVLFMAIETRGDDGDLHFILHAFIRHHAGDDIGFGVSGVVNDPHGFVEFK